jgi:hypothetical protein
LTKETTPGNAAAVNPLEVFVSYASEDEAMMQGLLKHLSGLEAEGLITALHNRSITPGAEWEKEGAENLRKSRIILLLVSPDFMASKFIHEKVLSAALERHRRGEARVIPVLIKPFDLGTGPLAQLQPVPRDDKPIVMYRPADTGFAEVSKELRKVIAEIKGQPLLPARP